MTLLEIRRLFDVVNGGTPTRNEDYWNGDIPWATPVDLSEYNGTRLQSTQRTLTSQGLEAGSNTVPAGSLIVSTRAPIGYVTESTAVVAFNQGCRGLVPKSDLDIRFFRYQLSAMREELQALGQGSTFMELSSDGLAATRIHVPPLPNQRAIADYLDVETSRIGELTIKKRLLSNLLEERWAELRRVRVLRGLNPVQGGGLAESWDEMNLGILIELHRGHDLPHQDRIEGEVPVVSSGGITGSHNVAISGGPGVVTGRYGTVGEVFFVDGPYWPLNTTLYVRDFRGNHPR